DCTRLRIALTIKDLSLITSDYNAPQRCQRRSENVYSAHQLVRTAIGVNAINHYRVNLKSLRRASRGECGATGDLIETQTVGFALLLRLLNEQIAQLRVGNRFGRSNDQVALPAGGHQSWLASAVPIGAAELFYRKTRHKNVRQDAVFDQFDFVRGLPFIVKLVESAQRRSAQIAKSGIVVYADEFRQHLVVELLGESLPFAVAAL